MSRKNCFIKLSGDTISSTVIEWIEQLSKDYFVVVCVGGGTQINDAFNKAGYTHMIKGPLGRECSTFEQRQLARDILEKNQSTVQDLLAEKGVHVNVVIPVIEIGTVLCHLDGDTMALNAYLGFDVIFVVTTPERLADKQSKFAQYPKIQVKAFD